MDPLLFPIGQSLGAVGDPVDGPLQRVRVDTRVFLLDGARFGLWALAHGTADPDAEEAPSAASVVERAAVLGVPDPERALAALRDDGLVADALPGDTSGEVFAARHRLVPLMLGLGNTAAEPDVYRIGLPGRPLAAVDASLYDLYVWAHLESDLAAACRAATGPERHHRRTSAPAAGAAELLASALEGLHTLLAPNAAYLDRASGSATGDAR